MKKSIMILAVVALSFSSCTKNESPAITETASTENLGAGQEAVKDDDSAPDIVKLAVSNPDLSTLVKGVQAAGLATSLSNAGPFTVFAPTNEAFAKLPAGTLEDLLKPENVDKLNDILSHHTYVGVIKTDQLTDGQSLGMVDGTPISIKMVNGKPVVNGTVNIIASVPASNGIVHVVDSVILPN
ncbi:MULTISPECIES: fasciclin domain-containing protein [unclassified Kaistella]|uniref:fasciclin domain-containing protein n=1 Tax=unclassified Kaistella TaxID=2762626 RepID=UPI002733A7A1|nr:MULTISPECIES: fasciclin domain-containing protein [unclassified Kaistella]MDP2454176.1 fasciclin domain-containing protein [Kaistella sp. SH11-4b]MDP2457753.1 fasciclin domain-containing protein [Kaistella sp. SH40-3]MDP2460511.1 fasciclin domain-containing protein [Kaistella sp. SH19-2b]